ncbi:MAG: DUF1801 domain-containing protein [Alphaproteobacteria bacterium]|nr:DUF1801 domain-containing protein [Alphaproteobacteria bacterium]
MAEPKTKPTKASVAAFLSAIEHEQRRKDAKAVDKIMRDVTGKKPVMWGDAIVGYGSYETKSGDWPRLGFSPRKANLVLYIMPGFKEAAPILKKLGKHKIGGSCLYINKLADVDEASLRALVKASWENMAAKHG